MCVIRCKIRLYLNYSDILSMCNQNLNLKAESIIFKNDYFCTDMSALVQLTVAIIQ